MSDDIKEIGDYDIDTSEELGSGSYGAVYPGTNRKTDKKVAAKMILLFNKELRDSAARELEILKLGRGHENILQIYYDKFEQKERFWIVMEYCDLGDLCDYTGEYPLSLYRKMDIVHQSTNALVYLLNLEPLHVVHRDIKPANILIKSEGNRIIAKIADFGISKTVTGTSPTHLQTKIGTEHYKAPELFNVKVKVYNRSIDVFSMGILILHLIRAKEKQRLDEDEVLGDRVGIGRTMYENRGKRESWNPIPLSFEDSDIVLQIKRMIGGMIQMDPEKRVTMEKVHEEVGKFKLALAPPVSTGHII